MLKWDGSKSKHSLPADLPPFAALHSCADSETLRQVRYGYNKEHDPLPQINLALLYSQKTMLPVCYRKLPGNIPDVKTVCNLLKEMDYLA